MIELKYLREIGKQSLKLTENYIIRTKNTTYIIPKATTYIEIEKIYLPEQKSFSCKIYCKKETEESTCDEIEIQTEKELDEFCKFFPKLKWENKSLYTKKDSKAA